MARKGQRTLHLLANAGCSPVAAVLGGGNENFRLVLATPLQVLRKKIKMFNDGTNPLPESIKIITTDSQPS